MALWDKIRGEFIDIIEWTAPSDSDHMAYRFPRYQHEIKIGAKLTVREGQVAVFVNEGKIADLFQPGMYELSTQNLPIMTTMRGWKYGFNSPFKAEVYFVQTKQFTDLKWGTSNPIMMRDTEFGMVRIRAFGTYVIKVVDPKTFIQQLVSTDPEFEVYEISSQLRNVIVSRFADVLAESKIPVLDLAGNYDKLGKFICDRINDEFTAFGIDLLNFYIENISLPSNVEEAMDRRTALGVVGNLDTYLKYQTAEAVREAAQNPSGGAAGIGAGLGAGMGIAQRMMESMGVQTGAPTASTPPPLPGRAVYYAGIGGAQQGPFDQAALQAKINSGEITRETLVWRQGMANWTAAGQVADLAALFAAVPPPLPAQK
jgi:membrane protease subunit (stomatin/prohibitin family)